MNQEKIGKFITKCRKAKKLTQSELAEQLGVTDRSVSNWENGKNMPDLSLFQPLCEILGITINELMSGEKIKQENYQTKLEENIINLTIDSKIRNQKKIKRLIILFSFVLFIYLLGTSLYNTIELDVRYDERLMKCSFDHNQLIYHITGNSVLNSDHTDRVIGDTRYIIFHNTINLYNKRHSNWEYGESLARTVNGEKIPFGIRSELDMDTNQYQNVIVYYTNKSLKKISKMNNTKFEKELQNFYQMCSLK